MASVTSATANPTGAADLLQALSSSASSALSSVLSPGQLQSAVQNASPGDLVKLSQQAIQLQVTAGLFGGSDTLQTNSGSDNLLLQALNSSLAGSTAAGATPSGSTAGGAVTGTSSQSGATAVAAASATESQQSADLFGTTDQTAQANSPLSFLG